MLKQLAVALGYAKAPRTTFFVRHPKTGSKAFAFRQVLRRSRTARRVSAGLVGVGAAAVALPTLAVLAIRKARSARKPATPVKRIRAAVKPAAARRAGTVAGARKRTR